MDITAINKSEMKDIEDIYALTPLQEGMLFHHIKSPNSDDYFEQLVVELSGEIDRKTVEIAWNKVIGNNEMLRVIFRWEGLKEPVQIVLKNTILNLRVFDDSSGLSDTLGEIKNSDRQKKFDLREVPFRITLIRKDRIKWYMIVSSHHIIYDGWSSGIILKEFIDALYSQSNSMDLQIPVKPKFKEYVKWLKGGETTNVEQFWRNYLSGIENPSYFPGKKGEFQTEQLGTPVGKIDSEKIERKRILTSIETKELCEAFTKHYKITQASLYYTAWAILLGKYCDSPEVIFGTTLSGRHAPIAGIENMVGLFIETLPLCVRRSTALPISTLLFQVNRELTAVEENAGISLVQIKALSQVDSQTELFDTLILLENYPLPEQTGGIRIENCTIEEVTHYDLTITINVSDMVEVLFSYSSGLFENGVMERLPIHFVRILEQIIENPGRTENKIDILSPQEREQLLIDFNSTQESYPQHKTILSMFGEQVKRTPDASAITGSSLKIQHPVHLTYQVLAEASNQMAADLTKKNVNPGALVAIKINRSLEMMIGIYGILAAGAAYIPIDPAYPEERIQFILTDSNVQCLITEGRIQEIGHSIIPEYYPPYLNLAYIIYTSGSTGKPKGVMINHFSVINRLNWMQKEYPIGVGDVILQKTPVVFDVSVWELFWWSFYGGRLCLLAPGEEKNPETLNKSIVLNNVTTLHFVPSMLGIYLTHVEEAEDKNALGSLKRVFSSGEALGSHLVKQFRQLLYENNQTELINLYGPTEATVDVSFFNCITENSWIAETIPIGKPIDNIWLLILDRNLNLQPLGIPGELCISGVGLARGYLNRPELTADIFCLRRPVRSFFKKALPPESPKKNPQYSYSPIYSLNHSTIYKTGDLAKWKADGNIEFLGRKDYQVKIRGFRIEPGEIRSCLLSYPGIKEAIVIAEKNSVGETYLCSYILGLQNKEEDIRKYLASYLPDYMIPAYIMQIPELPLNVNGKLDRQALPKPCFTGNTRYTPPETETEKRLAHLWAQLLEVDEFKIGSNDHFFRLGGHSLKAVLVLSRIHREFQVKLTLKEIFDQPVLKQQAEVIQRKESVIFEELKPAPLQPYYPLSSAQRRLFIVQQMNPDNIDYNMNWVFFVSGSVDVNRLESAFSFIIQRHEVLRTGIQMQGIKPIQVIHQISSFKLEYVTLADPKKEEYWGQNQLLEIVRQFVRPFDMSRPPLLRTGLVKYAEDKYILIIDLHHIVTDDVSNRILIEEMLSIYEGTDLPALKLQYKDYSQWQNQRLATGALKTQEEFWKQQFAGGIPRLNMPLDFPRPTIPKGKSEMVYITIEPELAAKIKEMNQKTATTSYMLLLAVYCICLSRISGDTDILVGSAVAGRRHTGLEGIVGMFVNMLAIRNYPYRHLSFSEFLEQVRMNTINAFDNQDFPFDILVESLGVEVRPGRNPVFDVEFNLFTTTTGRNWDTPIKAGGVTFTKALHHHDTLPYDLGLSVWEDRTTYRLELGYQIELFKQSTIRDWAEKYLEILELCLTQPEILLETITGTSNINDREDSENMLTQEDVLNFDF